MTTPHEESETPQLCYAMAYFVLPQYLEKQPERFLELLTSGPTTGAAFSYVMTCTLNEVEPRQEVARSLKVHSGQLTDTSKYHVIQYPVPPAVNISDIPEKDAMAALENVVLAPYFSAFIENVNGQANEMTNYILGQSLDGRTTLRSVDGNMNVNHGRGCEPVLDDFIDLLRYKRK